MTNRKLVSVIIPAYNASRYLGQAIDSALAQTYPNIEIIVVDDGSIDNTIEIAKRYGSRIHLLSQRNAGPANARNRAIVASRGDFLAFLDADDQWMPKKIAQDVRRLEDDATIALVHGVPFYLDQATNACTLRHSSRNRYVGNCYKLLFRENRITFSTVTVRRRCLERIGLFDETIRNAEDYDLLFRIARRFLFGYINEALTVYRLHETNVTRNRRQMDEGELCVIERALARDNTLARLVGRDAVNDRLFHLLYGLGYDAFQHEAYSRAHRFFRRALAIRRTHLHTWTLYIATLLPAKLVLRIRAMKSRVLPRRSAVHTGVPERVNK